MDSRHYPLPSIVQQDGHAIGGPHPDCHTGKRGHQGIVSFEILPREVRPVDDRDFRPVDLMSRYDGIRQD